MIYVLPPIPFTTFRIRLRVLRALGVIEKQDYMKYILILQQHRTLPADTPTTHTAQLERVLSTELQRARKGWWLATIPMAALGVVPLLLSIYTGLSLSGGLIALGVVAMLACTHLLLFGVYPSAEAYRNQLNFDRAQHEIAKVMLNIGDGS
ncbi:hypothetical protein [Xanthomonas perforans]|uniref:hypothetical protein n=1 Tax=Xanthomonas perforans TaxID=442694 RepID=UPI00235859DE|nr:hypothetical protein [Xanthomonas perforans]MDC9654396.1 hypothetical protein [Xanthomonas perforans]